MVNIRKRRRISVYEVSLAIIDAYLTDKIDIISTAIDKDGVETESIELDVSCRVEDKNKLLKNANGKEVIGNTFILLNPDTDIQYNDKIRITERKGTATQNPSKKFTIMQLSKPHGFSKSHCEVWL